MPDEVFGGEVAGGALGVRAAAEAAGGAVDRGDAFAEGGQGVGERLAVGVVEVHGELVDADARGAERLDQRGHLPGRRDADRVAEGQLVAAELDQPRADLHHLIDRYVALPRIAVTHRDVPADRSDPSAKRPLRSSA